MANKGICNKCQNPRIIFYKGMCQTCYKKEVSNAKAIAKYKSIYQGESIKIKRILELAMEKKYSRKEIAAIVGYSHKAVCAVCKQFLIKE